MSTPERERCKNVSFAAVRRASSRVRTPRCCRAAPKQQKWARTAACLPSASDVHEPRLCRTLSLCMNAARAQESCRTLLGQFGERCCARPRVELPCVDDQTPCARACVRVCEPGVNTAPLFSLSRVQCDRAFAHGLAIRPSFTITATATRLAPGRPSAACHQP